MTWTTFGVLVVAGTIGAWLGMLLSRRRRKQKKNSNQGENPE